MTEYENDIRSEAVQNFIKTQCLELKKFHALGGPIHESVAFNAELYKDGKRVTLAQDDGNGGGVYLSPDTVADQVTIEAVEAALKEAAIVWFISEYGDKKPHHWELDDLVTEMAMDILEEKEWQAKTRTKVFVRTSDCGKDEFYTYKRQCKVSDKDRNAKFELFVVDAIVKRFGVDNIVEIRGLRTIDNWKEAETVIA
jgi:hypothetical protein